MDQSLKFKLSLAGISCTSLSQFSTGFLLYDLFLHKLPRTEDLLKLKSRLKSSSTDKPNQKANEVVNLNILLKYLRKEVVCPERIQELSVFNIIDSEDRMRELVEWVLGLKGSEGEMGDEDSLNESEIEIHPDEDSLAQYQNKRPNNYQMNESYNHKNQSPPRDNQLANLYYVSQKENNPNNMNAYHDDEEDYSLNIPKEQVVKSSTSIKIIKPRSSFHNNDSFFSQQETPVSEPIPKPQKLSMPPKPQIPPLPRQQNREDESQSIVYKQFQKSTPKVTDITNISNTNRAFAKSFEKGFDNSSVKVSTTSRTHQEKNHESNIKDIREFPLYEHQTSSKIKELEKEVQQIEKSIGKERREIVSIKRSSRSLQKKQIEVDEIPESSKVNIVEWLISINLLNSMVRGKVDQLPRICKKGVIFPELINQKKQRSDPEIKYESKPNKSAQIHANYRRVFQYLSKLNNFTSNFLFAYQNFIPEISQNVFWAFMLELMNYYKGNNKKKPSSTSKIVIEQAERPSAPPIKTERQDYEKIRFSLQHKSSSKPVLPKRRDISEDSDQERQERPLKQQRIEENGIAQSRIETNVSFVSVSSYQQLRLKKEMLVDTPRRDRSLKRQDNSSLGKNQESRLSLKNSKVGLGVSEEMPTITPEMQKVATTYLRSQCLGIDINNLLNFKEMFDDPIRNGTLLMLIACKHFNLKAQEFVIKPKSINDCRLNLSKALNLIKEKQAGFPSAFLSSAQYILKGSKSIFYGIIYHLVHKVQIRNQVSINQSFTNFNEHKETILTWIRSLKPGFESMRYIEIDSFESILEHMSTGILLNQLASLITKRTLKLVYDKPQYHVQYRANIMKTLEALIEKEIIDKDLLWKAKKISTGDTKTIVTLLDIFRKKLTLHGWMKSNTLPFQELIKAYCTK